MIFIVHEVCFLPTSSQEGKDLAKTLGLRGENKMDEKSTNKFGTSV